MNTETLAYEPSTTSTLILQLRGALDGLMVVTETNRLSDKTKPVVQFTGHLAHGDPDAHFEAIVQRFETLGYTPLLSQEDGQHVLRAMPVVADREKTGRPWVNVVLFILTLLSVLFLGALHENVDVLAEPLQIWRGWPFALSIMGILTAHELSHYFIGKRYGSPTSLPYFIPLPLGILGTMGAVIVQRGPMKSRKALFDIGVAGPLGGLIVAIPFLFIGLALSYVGRPQAFMEVPPGTEPILTQEGNSLLYLLAKLVVHGRILPDPATGEDIWLSPPSPGGSIAFAAWAGLLVTALNLFPIGQFDGGHVAYAMWGRKAWTVARVFLVVIFAWGVILTMMGNQAGASWLVWGGLGLLMGPRHPPPLNDLTPLDRKRKILGWVMVAIFILILTPVPLINTAL